MLIESTTIGLTYDESILWLMLEDLIVDDVWLKRSSSMMIDVSYFIQWP